MTVSSNVTRSEATGNGTVGPFTFTFKILDETHIKVLVDGTEQTLSTHYTVSGVGADGGGTITFVSGSEPATDAEIVMLRNVPYLQETAYTEGDAFPEDAHEDALDLAIMQIQQLLEKLGRMPQLAEESLFEDIVLPDPVDGYYLQWSSGNLVNVALASSDLAEFSEFGTGLVALETVGEVQTSLGMSTYFKTLLDDANAASILTSIDMSTYASVVVSTDETMASASDEKLPTEGTITSYVAAQLAVYQLAQEYVKVSDTKTSGTAGGGSSATTWNTRTLNTEDSDVSSVCSLAANQITLDAGTYDCLIMAPAYKVDGHKLRLRNVTAGSTLLVGPSMMARDTGDSAGYAMVQGRFTVAASQALEVQHYTARAEATSGLGAATSTEEDEVYTVAEFWKVA